MRSLIPAAFIVLGLASGAAAQTSGSGMSMGFGVGAGHASMDCSRCGDLQDGDPWRGGWGPSGYFDIDYRVNPHVRLGADIDLWARRSFSEQRDATLFSAAAVAHYQPIDAVDLVAGAGPASTILAGGPGYIAGNGWALVVGAAFERQSKARVRLAPFVRYVQLRAAAAAGDNRGVRAVGPANPGSVQFGVGFRWD
jgi:hypothetical protein